MHTSAARLGAVVSALLVTGLLGACQPTAEALPRLTDPAEILEEAVRTTAELDFVQLQVEVEVGIPGGGGNVEVTGAAEIDMRTRDLHGAMEIGGLGMGGGERQEFLVIGSDAWSKSASAEKWFHSRIPPGQDPRAQVPATPAIAEAVTSMLGEDGIALRLEGDESCATGGCYHVVATIAPELIWQLAQGAFLGGVPGDDPVPPADPAIPEVSLDILVDEATRNLVSVGTAGMFEDASFDATVTLTGHDVPFQLRPPAPNQVEEEGGGVIEEVPAVPVP